MLSSITPKQTEWTADRLKMKLLLFQIDAFASQIFEGNPAAVVHLTEWLPDELMQQIAMENQLSETAFFFQGKEQFHLRWFTPVAEVDLCGHATLATAHALMTEMNHPADSIEFVTRSGILTVRKEEGQLEMAFPIDPIEPDESFKKQVSEILNTPVIELWKGREDWLAVVESETAVRHLQPDLRKLASQERRGLIVTAKGESAEVVSRCFFPKFGIDEDPVTGSAHTTLAAYWCDQLSKSDFSARQISSRGGNVHCRRDGETVFLSGTARTYLRGEIEG